MRTTQRETRENYPDIDEMRYDLAEHEAMNMNVSQIIEYLIYGFAGLDDVPDVEIKDEWEQTFGVDKDKNIG